MDGGLTFKLFMPMAFLHSNVARFYTALLDRSDLMQIHMNPYGAYWPPDLFV